MNSSRRKFFCLAAGASALPVAGLAKAMSLTPKPKVPEPIPFGAKGSSADMNARFDAIWRAIRNLS